MLTISIIPNDTKEDVECSYNVTSEEERGVVVKEVIQVIYFSCKGSK